MKPVRLEFSGLHSYVTPQSVDFAELGAGGIFGIFGPTGSGKSTILDAMTLALFGNVDRASRGTQGIVNQRATYARVSFEFALGADSYKVERRYDRNSKDPTQPGWDQQKQDATLTRFEGDRGVPLADKPREVTAAVENLLGLGAAEFSRAVILPQGKFDEFIKLAGAERSKMLQHIFALERFGVGLSARVDEVVRQCDLELREIAGAQSQLGDCSQERIAAAGEELEQLEAGAAAAEERVATAEERHREAAALCRLLARRNDVERRREELRAREAQVAVSRERLASARDAEPLRSLVEQETAFGARVAEGARELGALREKAAATQQTHAVHLQESQAAESALAAQEPGLRQRERDLEQGVATAARLAELRQRETECDQQLAEARQREETADSVATTQEADLQGKRDAIARLEAERLKRVADPAEKERLDKVLEALLLLKRAEEEAAKAGQRRDERQEQANSLWHKTVSAFQGQFPGEVPDDGDDLLERVARAKAEAEALLQAAETRLSHEQAALLAAGLQSDAPCPVCGSREHPAPAEGGAEVAEAAAERETQKRKVTQLAAWGSGVELAHARWVSAAAEWDKAIGEEADQHRLAREARERFDALSGGLAAEDVVARKERLKQWDAEAAEFQRQKAAAEAAVAGLDAAAASARREHLEAKSVTAGFVANRENVREQRVLAEAELTRLAVGADPGRDLVETRRQLEALKAAANAARRQEEESRRLADGLALQEATQRTKVESDEAVLGDVRARLGQGLAKAGFADLRAVQAALLTDEESSELKAVITRYEQECGDVTGELNGLERDIAGRSCSAEELAGLSEELSGRQTERDRLREELAVARAQYETLTRNLSTWSQLEGSRLAQEARKTLAFRLKELFRGGKFAEFLAEEHLRDMAAEASLCLGRLTNQRYALELADQCNFEIRDDFNGSQRRPVSTLSGGETFLTSLALALALSSKIQLKGQPLGFFFLDEGFGTLDEEKLDLVMGALEKLPDRERIVGVISHVKELQERLPRYLKVTPASQDGSGSSLSLHRN